MHRDLRFLVKVHAHMSICPQHVGGTHNIFYAFGFGNLGELVRYQDIQFDEAKVSQFQSISSAMT